MTIEDINVFVRSIRERNRGEITSVILCSIESERIVLIMGTKMRIEIKSPFQ